MKRKWDVTLNGYYGFESLGDDAMLAAILFQIGTHMPDSAARVICNKVPRVKHSENVRVSYIPRKNIFKILYTLLKTKVFVSGGGSLLQDATSKRSLFYYTLVLKLAKLCGCKIFLLANGIGPLSKDKKAKASLLLADAVSVRDPESLRGAKRITSRVEPSLRADPVFAREYGCIEGDKRLNAFAVSLRSCLNGQRTDTRALAQIINRLRKNGATPIYVPMQESYDLDICLEMQRLTGGLVARVSDEEELMGLLSKMSFAFGMRLHFLFFSIMAKTPTVALSYDTKVKSSMEYLGIRDVFDAFCFDGEELYSALSCVMNNYDARAVEKRVRELRRLSGEDGAELCRLCLSCKEKKRGKRFGKFGADVEKRGEI